MYAILQILMCKFKFFSMNNKLPAGKATNAPPNSNAAQQQQQQRQLQIRQVQQQQQKQRLQTQQTQEQQQKQAQQMVGLGGLKNLGNSCYMNTILQCCSNTHRLLEYIKSRDYLKDINQDSYMQGALVKAFADVLFDIWRDVKVVDTAPFKREMEIYVPQFRGKTQQDAQEFLGFLLEGLHEELNKGRPGVRHVHGEIVKGVADSVNAERVWNHYNQFDDSKIVDLFVGQYQSNLDCTVCNHCRVNFEPFWDISLPIPTTRNTNTIVTLANCFDLFTKEEDLDGDEQPVCSNCHMGQKCRHKKTITIQRYPKILILHLKRYFSTVAGGKLTTYIDCPMENFDLGPWTTEKKFKIIYKLYAIANHNGTAYNGHYTASCRNHYTGDWHSFNDTKVVKISSRNVMTPEAYVLFYELVEVYPNPTISTQGEKNKKK